jgi:hypothetical protein
MDANQQHPATVGPEVRLCRLCGERAANAARVKHWDYRCNPCRKQSPAHKAWRQRNGRTPKERARAAERAKKRIMVGSHYHSMAKTAEQAQRINAHVKERMCHFRAIRDKNAN